MPCCSTTCRSRKSSASVRLVAQATCGLEVTGGVTLSNVREYAETGVHDISVGALTHSARAIDIGLDF